MSISRRGVLFAGGAALVALSCKSRKHAAPTPAAAPHSEAPPVPTSAESSSEPPATAAQDSPIIRRPIPSSGELIAAVGLGSWQTFDVAPDQVEPIQPVLDQFLALGGQVIDTSPMYGRAEAAIGTMLAKTQATGAPLLATKVWTEGQRAGIEQMNRSFERLGTEVIDLMQIHNLVDWQRHLPTLRQWKQDGRIRYLGITHYQHSAFAELERLIRTEAIDSVQLPYSVLDRAAEKRLLPAAADAGVAVLVLSPFESGALFRRVKGRPVPEWAGEIQCDSWAQIFLKFLLGHPTVTCPLPATSKPHHLIDNMGALRGPVPDADLRRRIVAAVEGTD